VRALTEPGRVSLPEVRVSAPEVRAWTEKGAGRAPAGDALRNEGII